MARHSPTNRTAPVGQTAANVHRQHITRALEFSAVNVPAQAMVRRAKYGPGNHLSINSDGKAHQVFAFFVLVYVEYQKSMSTSLLLLQIRGFLSYQADRAAI